jgi:hypothetical protein
MPRRIDFVANVERVRAWYATLPANLARGVFNFAPLGTDGMTFSVWKDDAAMQPVAHRGLVNWMDAAYRAGTQGRGCWRPRAPGRATGTRPTCTELSASAAGCLSRPPHLGAQHGARMFVVRDELPVGIGHRPHREPARPSVTGRSERTSRLREAAIRTAVAAVCPVARSRRWFSRGTGVRRALWLPASSSLDLDAGPCCRAQVTSHRPLGRRA